MFLVIIFISEIIYSAFFYFVLISSKSNVKQHTLPTWALRIPTAWQHGFLLIDFFFFNRDMRCNFQVPDQSFSIFYQLIMKIMYHLYYYILACWNLYHLCIITRYQQILGLFSSIHLNFKVTFTMPFKFWKLSLNLINFEFHPIYNLFC